MTHHAHESVYDRRPTWWDLHAHLVTLWAAAVLAAFLTGSLPFGSLVGSVEFYHQHRHSKQEHPTDWRAGRWVPMVATLGVGISALLMQRDERLLGLAIVYSIAQVALSDSWHRVAPPQREKLGGDWRADYRVRLLGITGMLIAVAAAYQLR